MVTVAEAIEHYPLKKFLQLSARAQNSSLYEKFKCKTPGQKSNIRVQKKSYLQKIIVLPVSQNVKKQSSPDTAGLLAKVNGGVKSTPGHSHTSTHNNLPPAGETHPGSSATNLNKALSFLSGNIPSGSRSYINEIVAIQAEFKKFNLQCNVQDAVKLRQSALQISGGQDIPPWSIPFHINDKNGKNLYNPNTYEQIVDKSDWPNPDPSLIVKGVTKQVLIIKAICDPNIEIVAVEADKRKGKSTAAFSGICQGVWENIFKVIGMWAAGEDNAIGILGDVFRDEVSVNNTLPLFKGTGSQKQKVFFNNSLIKAFSNNAARTSGLDFDLCWIDEGHEVVVEHPEVFDMIIMTMRAKPSIKLLITMNKGTGTYHIFRDTLEKEFGSEVAFFTIEDGDITHITQKADRKVRTLVKAVGGKKEVDRWLNNKAVSLSTFDTMSVIYAFENYALFLSTHDIVAKYTVASYDPSGTGHPMGYSIWSCDATGTFFWQRFGIEYELGERPEEWGLGEKLNHHQIQADMLERAHEFHATHFISESNMDGKNKMIEFRMRGYTSENQNYGNDKNKDSTPSRGAMCHIVRTIMDNQALFINSQRLRDQWSIYSPEAHEKVAKFKGDEADSGIHAIYYLCTLTNSPYLSQESYEMEWI